MKKINFAALQLATSIKKDAFVEKDIRVRKHLMKLIIKKLQTNT